MQVGAAEAAPSELKRAIEEKEKAAILLCITYITCIEQVEWTSCRRPVQVACLKCASTLEA